MNGHAADTADPELPMLSVAQAARLRELAAPYRKEGARYSLHNLAHWCRNTPEERWPQLVADHFADLDAAEAPGGADADGLLRAAYPRLLPTDAVTPDLSGAMRYARVVADGLVFAYAVDAPTTVRILTDPDIERAGPDELGAAAFANLARLPVRHEEVPLDGGAVLHSVYGDEPFVASKALALPDLVREVTGQPLPDAGALFAVPARHLLAFHPIADGTVVEAVNGLASYALGAYQDAPGPLSPRVYWWHEGRLTSLTVIDDETRSFSLQPPPQLLGRMKGLTALDRAGRLATRTATRTTSPDARTHTHTLTAALDRLAQGEQEALGEAFGAAVVLAHARCADDPEASHIDTWDAWAVAVQLGSALFTGAGPQECVLGEDQVWRVPAVPAQPPADAHAWLDAFCVSLVCRQAARLDRLCQVPLETLRQDDSADAHVLHWIDTLRAYWSEEPIDDVVQKLIATMEVPEPGSVSRAPQDFVNLVDYPPTALFHRFLTRDHDKFTEALSAALAGHRAYWDGAREAPRAQVALGPLAMACLAYDNGFPFAERRPYLPESLLDRGRIEVIPG